MPKDKEPKERYPFQYGPRDNGPFNPPPWPQLVQVGMAIVLMLTAGIIGANYVWIGGVYVQGPCAFLCMVGLMVTMAFVGDGFDRAQANGDNDQPYNHDK
ncbi:MAG: hypothetical protein IT342_24555 [Candidatus Melainabacteria bacterium]|nr:hypothetical protein [Candidatus Melainabacteria bacterium]